MLKLHPKNTNLIELWGKDMQSEHQLHPETKSKVGLYCFYTFETAVLNPIAVSFIVF